MAQQKCLFYVDAVKVFARLAFPWFVDRVDSTVLSAGIV